MGTPHTRDSIRTGRRAGDFDSRGDDDYFYLNCWFFLIFALAPCHLSTSTGSGRMRLKLSHDAASVLCLFKTTINTQRYGQT